MRDMGTIELINGQANRGLHPNLRQKEKARSKRESNDEGPRATMQKNRKVEISTYQKADDQKSIHFLKRRKKVQRISESRRTETTTYHRHRRNRLARSKHIKKRESRSIIDY